MKMKQIKLANAYQMMERFMDEANLPVEKKWKLFNMRRALAPYYEFQQIHEVAIRRKYAPYTDQDGNMTGETYSNFLAELEELSNMDVEVPDMERIEMPVADMTVREMEALDGFIDFCLQK